MNSVTSRLRAGTERPDPVRLTGNAQKSFIGAYLQGKGFILSLEEAEELLSQQPNRSEVVRRYIGGAELNSSPRQDAQRYVISFGNVSLDEAGKWPELVRIVRERVKPERERSARNAQAERIRKLWWRFQTIRPTLLAALEGRTRCIACSQVSKHCVFAFQPVGRVFGHTLNVFPLDRDADLGILQSRVHESWARLMGSSLEDRLRYTPPDCFETFPFPSAAALGPDAPLEAIAAELYETRANFMVDTDQGLTKTYNALKDPENTDPRILHLRQLHEQLDRAVLDAYGQSHIEVPPYCGADPTTLERFEDEVLDFLFALNEQRAKEEAKAASRAQS